ncbi:MAG TPA: cupin domain-containing protein [Candidatus Binatia bacterium]|nr:cupin domain-containing protein [Candidatus Binatia bacterium]
MKESVRNIYTGARPASGAEIFETLFEAGAVRIERITSHASSSPEGFWYDQEQDEWILLLRGAAVLEFAAGELIEMREGDCLIIPRHVRHRVRETSEETIWLAVHLKEPPGNSH